MMRQEQFNLANKRLITKKTAAARLSVSTRTLDRMVAEGVLKKVFLRGSVRFKECDIDEITECGV